MATPVFKFNHPKSKEDFYFIHDTYYELPKTTPMCLATFVYYHLQINRSLSGFLVSFDDINESGSSLFNTSFEDFYNKNEKDFFLQQVEDTGALKNAEILSEESSKLRSFLMSKKIGGISIDKFYHENMKDTIFEFRGNKYYVSLSDLYDNLSKMNEKQDDLPF